METAKNDRKRLAIILAFAAALLIPFCFLGYGSDNDTYLVLDAGRSTWQQHILQTSRPPGYWTYEAVIFFLSRIGGYALTNLVTLGVALLVALQFFRLARRLAVCHPFLFTASMIAVPTFAIGAVSTMDYVWSLLGLLVFVEALLDRRWVLIFLAGTFAYLFRPTNGLLIFGLFLGDAIYLLNTAHPSRASQLSKLLGVGSVILLVGSLPLVLSYKCLGPHFMQGVGLDNPAMWTLKMHVGRVGFKTMMLFGLPSFLWLAGGAVQHRRGNNTGYGATTRDQATYVLIGGLLANFLLFVKFPLEISYLLPAAACFLLLVGKLILPQSRPFALGLTLLLVSANLVTVQVAKPNQHNHATSAKLGFAVVRGELLEDASERLQLLQCKTYQCWADRQADMPE